MYDSGKQRKFTKARLIFVVLLSVVLVAGIYLTKNSTAVKGPMTATEYCKLLYDAPVKIWEAQSPPKIRKIAEEIEKNETNNPKLNDSGKNVAKAIYNIADAVEETLKDGLSGDLFSAIAGIGVLGVAAAELGVAEANVVGCDNWTPPPTNIPA